MADKLIAALRNNRAETEALLKAAPDWRIAANTWNELFKCMADPKDPLWKEPFIRELHHTYLKARDEDKSCSNITVRTLKAMPANRANETKTVMLQLANACRVFNASHKVNFEQAELPADFSAIPVTTSKKKGEFTYRNPMPSIYAKTSLTFDYWVPKMLEWTNEIRDKKWKDWRGDLILQQESCTDFMRICLLFLSDFNQHPPVAKTEDRETFLKLFGEEFVWIKKSAKREDISGNSAKIAAGLKHVSKEAGIKIPMEAWSRLQQAPFIKSILQAR